MTVNMHLHHTEAFLRNRRSRAATIVELLVSISIIAMLIAILTPALRAARTHAHEATSLAHLRSLGVTVSLYASDNNGAAPYAEPGRDTLTWGFENGRQERFVFAPVWSLEVYWPAVVRSVATWRDNFDTWRSPGSAQLGIGRSSVTTGLYEYSNSFLAKPRVWSGGPASEADVGPVSMDMVTAPSAKVIFFDAVRAYLRRATPHTPRPLLFVDGAAALRLDRDATAPVQNPLHHRAPQRYHDTPLGAKGRDF